MLHARGSQLPIDENPTGCGFFFTTTFLRTRGQIVASPELAASFVFSSVLKNGFIFSARNLDNMRGSAIFCPGNKAQQNGDSVAVNGI